MTKCQCVASVQGALSEHTPQTPRSSLKPTSFDEGSAFLTIRSFITDGHTSDEMSSKQSNLPSLQFVPLSHF